MRSFVCMFVCLLVVVWPSAGCGGCNGESNGECKEACVDADGDGFCEVVGDENCDFDDCDDGDGSINPEAEEDCDGQDNDCDGDVDEGVTNACGSCGEVPEEVCDGQDNDCDGEVDEGVTNACGTCGAVPEEVCDGEDNDCDGEVDEGVTTSFYADEDGDGFGDPDVMTEACDAPRDYVTECCDCDDTSDFAAVVYPGAEEVCDGQDNDCNDSVDDGLTFLDYYVDADADGYGTGDPVSACEKPDGYVLDPGDCDDGEPATYPGATEVCDGKDNDCNASPDDGLTFLDYYEDTDGDGVGTGDPVSACEKPDGYVLKSGDCDDVEPATHPGATEVCDGKDNDCDGLVDEDLTFQDWYADGDSDGYGAGNPVSGCKEPNGETAYVLQDGDCDDGNDKVNPGEAEVSCDLVNNDCNEATVDGPDNDGDGYNVCCDAEDDTNASIHPDPWEMDCDGLDNNCNGLIDESCWNETDEDPPEFADAKWDSGIWAP